jgi:hypothetical protein
MRGGEYDFSSRTELRNKDIQKVGEHEEHP